ncbi:RNA-dependent RNA polymerase [Ustilaginoidea virens RNA virus 3]|uniref:RNA-directed RNA polymerase n=1 Tax=Ustilaginoidea virens RNA virus 3 TaxID=1460374 RepID=W5TY53_9VIRU|nr:RNA-dependent RNA polymerase [Ustilaginoidea virens RNA virus 3]AHH25155.1 RNA-dependent RNA polymerase [Ustilaginoidea virens RNA virus 3]
MGDDVITDRANKHGLLGQYLVRWLRPYETGTFTALPLDEQMSYIYRPFWGSTRPPALARAALSYLGADMPIQVVLSDSDFKHILTYLPTSPDLPATVDVPAWVFTKAGTMQHFRPKAHAKAVTKANIFLDEVLRDARRLDANFVMAAWPYLDDLRSNGITHDQAVAFVLYAWALKGKTVDNLRWAHFCCSQRKEAKEVSNFLKAVGGNAHPLGAMMVETDTLAGRGTGESTLLEGAIERCDLAALRASKLAEFDENSLRRAIRRILVSEISRNDTGGYHLAFPALSDHWASRWRWAVNGSHSAEVDRQCGFTPPPLPGGRKYHRRAWLETRADDPRPGWDGTTYVSASDKLEHGKTRTILACDTRSYLAFEHLMGTVEKAWRGTRVILNPGKGGHIGMANRVERNRNRSGVSMMLDYDDFNSHHSNEAMKILVEETCQLTGYPAELAAPLIASFDKQRIYVAGKYVGVSRGTLMSGHRCTTYINSVLNMAYLMVVLGDDFVMERPTLHVGDDVFFGVRSYSEACYVARSVLASRLRMNRSKQSVGHVATEFLRVSSRARDSYGYLCRAISSCVSGNWVSDKLLDPYEALNTMLGSARTLMNRAISHDLPLLLASAIKRTVRADGLNDRLLTELLLGSVAVNNGPQFSSSGTHRIVWVQPQSRLLDPLDVSLLPRESTASYLVNCAQPIETQTLARVGISPVGTMLASSYAKSLDYARTQTFRLSFSAVHTYRAVGSTTAELALASPKPRGILNQYPLLVLVKHRLPENVLREVVATVGGNGHAERIVVEAWGEYRHGCIINSVLSFSDASALGKRVKASVLTSGRHCYV